LTTRCLKVRVNVSIQIIAYIFEACYSIDIAPIDIASIDIAAIDIAAIDIAAIDIAAIDITAQCQIGILKRSCE
jgi:hypothetical protein